MVDERLKAALTRAGVPVARLKYTGRADTFITFRLLDGGEENHSDDDSHAEALTYRMDVFSKSDYTELVKTVKQAIKAAGFYGIVTGPEMYESDTEFYHMPIEANYMREDVE